MGPNWDKEAPTYDKLVFCELEDTRSYLDAIGLTGNESVLDVCCGPGRISVLAAERGCDVTGVDSSREMLHCALENARAFEVESRCRFIELDWDRALRGQNLQMADVVIASRCHAMMDVERLSSFARQKVMVQIFADAPSIPALKNVLFDGCGEPMAAHGGPAPRTTPDGAPEASHGKPPMGGPKGPMGMPGGRPKHLWPPEGSSGWREGSAYLDIFLKAYGAGYAPNCRIMPERFRKKFDSENEAIDWVCSLAPERSKGNEDRVAQNTAPFLADKDGKVEFCIATEAAIIWWDVAPRAF